MSVNPYDSPPSYSSTQPESGDIERPIGMLPHLPVLAAFMMLQGGISVLFGISMAGFSLVFPIMMMQEDAPPGMEAETMGLFMFGIYFGMGAIVGIPGVIMLWSGIQLLKFKGRVLGMVALGIGLVSGLVCYCLPTGIAMLIYGLIVLNNAEVRTAFDMQYEGNTWRQIMRYFYGPVTTAK